MSDGEREILERVGVNRRSFIKRMLGSAFAIPVVTSFGLNALTMSSAAALAPNQQGGPGASELARALPPRERGEVLGGLARLGIPPGHIP